MKRTRLAILMLSQMMSISYSVSAQDTLRFKKYQKGDKDFSMIPNGYMAGTERKSDMSLIIVADSVFLTTESESYKFKILIKKNDKNYCSWDIMDNDKNEKIVLNDKTLYFYLEKEYYSVELNHKKAAYLKKKFELK